MSKRNKRIGLATHSVYHMAQEVHLPKFPHLVVKKVTHTISLAALGAHCAVITLTLESSKKTASICSHILI